MLSVLAKDIHVSFPIYDSNARSLKHSLAIKHIAKGVTRLAPKSLNVGGHIGAGDTGRIVIKALDGVSFELCEGDRVGILGHNGSGKTTLLRTIAGIYEPLSGDIQTNGRVFPLFDLQLGMDQDATGMENIWLRGKMLGLTTPQIHAALADIAEFTELEIDGTILPAGQTSEDKVPPTPPAPPTGVDLLAPSCTRRAVNCLSERALRWCQRAKRA